MTKHITVYDPSGGWKYGFPKEYLPLPGETLVETLIRDGYPKELCEAYSKHLPCRFWEVPKDD